MQEYFLKVNALLINLSDSNNKTIIKKTSNLRLIDSKFFCDLLGFYSKSDWCINNFIYLIDP